MNDRFLFKLTDIQDGGSRGFSVELPDGTALEGFLVRQGERVFAYRNRCPHTGAPLDWSPDNFLDSDGRYIICAMHGALFEVVDGLCVYGPCVARRLEALQLVLDGGEIRLRLP